MWAGELAALRQFTHDLEARPPLPSAKAEQLEEHSRQIAAIQELLSRVAAMPLERRPPVADWDDVLGPLWRRLFAKGDDIHRYVLADLWSRTLAEAGEVERSLIATIGVVASARNFYRFEEALERCQRGRALASGRPSAPLAQLINVEGSIHYFTGDFEGAERLYREALQTAAPLSSNEMQRWIGATKSDFVSQEYYNILETYLDRGNAALPRERSEWSARARQLQEALDSLVLSGGFHRFRAVAAAGFAILEGDFAGTRKALDGLRERGLEEGPYRYPLRTTHCRLQARICQLEGDWAGAYGWVRRALQEGLNHCFPSEEQQVLDQALQVLRGLNALREPDPEKTLVADIVQLLEDKDWYTGRSHSRSVGELAVRVGGDLHERGRDDIDLSLLHRAGLLHDIGKLRCPWSLLNKIAPITAPERSLLQDHSAHGGTILRAVGMEPVAAVVEQHHETMDGSGYPRRVVPGPMGAIVGLCDVYEASVTPNRRYKLPKSRDEALREIQELAGTRYWRPAVEALVRVVGRA